MRGRNTLELNLATLLEAMQEYFDKRYSIPLGTRYLFADTYQAILDRRVLKPRIYPPRTTASSTARPSSNSCSNLHRHRPLQHLTLRRAFPI